MSIAHVCDYCGETIVPGDTMATLDVQGERPCDDPGSYRKTESISGWLGHYHTSDEHPCWWKVHEAFEVMHASAPSLERIETLSNQQVAARRRKHSKSGEGQ